MEQGKWNTLCNNGWIFIALALIACTFILGSAYKYKYKTQESIVVTGLGEQTFTSDLIVWRGCLTVESSSVEAGYRVIEANKKKVQEYLKANNIADSSVLFMFVETHKKTESIYNNSGAYSGERFVGYLLQQVFSVESTDIDAVENISREISSLIAQGIQIESWQPEYYYTQLDGLKLQLIEKATADARIRAESITSEAGAKLKGLKSARMGVFQITGANTNEEFSAGGNFNTSSKNKKARITMRLEYNVK